MLNHLTGALLVLAGFMLFMRQLLLSSDADSFPCAPTSVQIVMFLAGTACVGMGALFWGAREPFAGRASTAIAILVGVMLLYHGVMLVNVASQRRPAAVWKRLGRIWQITCSPKRNRSEISRSPF